MSFSKGQVLGFVCVLAIALPCFPSKTKTKSKPSFEQLSKATALVQSQTGSGSGFFMTSSLLVTSYHVVQNAYLIDGQHKVVVIGTQDGDSDFGIVIATDVINDLAIIKTLKKGNKFMPLGSGKDYKKN